MRAVLAAGLLFAVLAFPAHAADVTASSEIDAVTVCTNGPSKIQMTPGEQLKVGPGVAKTDDVLATRLQQALKRLEAAL